MEGRIPSSKQENKTIYNIYPSQKREKNVSKKKKIVTNLQPKTKRTLDPTTIHNCKTRPTNKYLNEEEGNRPLPYPSYKRKGLPNRWHS